MPEDFGGWEIIERLGAGAQGEVHLVRNPDRVRERGGCLKGIEVSITSMTSTYRPDAAQWLSLGGVLSKAIVEYGRPEKPEELGALKRFNIRQDDPNAQKAILRFHREVDALKRLAQPGILKLLRDNLNGRWMITEYHPGSTLDGQREKYAGRALAALEAFRPLVASVAALQAYGIVHRDIKPANIFIASDGRLVLGDFGILYFEDERRERLTDTFERVGARDWMAPWANTGVRIDDVKPSFDVFPLGKVLWSMVSGLPQLPYWYYDRDQYNVEKRFPDEPAMPNINGLLKRCVVENEQDCLPTAKELLECVDDSLRTLRRGGHLSEEGGPGYCQICGKGLYRRQRDLEQLSFAGNPISVSVFICENCGHVEVFRQPRT
ncbi:MAG: protein kinase [Bryobacteraceae bacterium]